MPSTDQRPDGERIERLLGGSERRGLAGIVDRLGKRARLRRDARRREAELLRAVMERLPDASPETFRALAQLVLGAWTDPSERAELRDNPGKFFTSRGVRLPHGTQFAIVSPSDAALPVRSAVFIPLPPDDDAALTEAEARAALSDSAWAWMLGLPFAEDPTFDKARSRGVVQDAQAQSTAKAGRNSADDDVVPSIRAKMFNFRRGTAYTAAGILAAAIGTIWITFGRRGEFGVDGALSGAIVDAPGFALWLGLAVVTLIVAIAAWMTSRR